MAKAKVRRATGTPAERVSFWLAHPDASIRARLASDMFRRFVGQHDAKALGASNSIFAQTVNLVRDAGFSLDEEPRPYGGTAYRVRTGPPITTTRPGTAHPELGAVLTVRALALSADGLVVQLSAGNGSGWTAVITGYVE